MKGSFHDSKSVQVKSVKACIITDKIHFILEDLMHSRNSEVKLTKKTPSQNSIADSIANPDTMFEKMIINQNKNLEIVIEDPSSPVIRQNMHYIEMSLFNAFYEDCIDFKNHIRDILDTR